MMQQPVLLSPKFGTNFYAITVKYHSSMQNWLFDLVWWIHCEQFPWCQRKWWKCSWLCSLPFLPFLVSVSLDFPCTAHAFFPQNLSNHCQSVHHTFS
jgi:hypothetical protein